MHGGDFAAWCAPLPLCAAQSKMEQVRKRLDSLRALLGSACAQVLAPPLIAATLGLLLLLHTGLPAQVRPLTLPPLGHPHSTAATRDPRSP